MSLCLVSFARLLRGSVSVSFTILVWPYSGFAINLMLILEYVRSVFLKLNVSDQTFLSKKSEVIVWDPFYIWLVTVELMHVLFFSNGKPLQEETT